MGQIAGGTSLREDSTLSHSTPRCKSSNCWRMLLTLTFKVQNLYDAFGVMAFGVGQFTFEVHLSASSFLSPQPVVYQDHVIRRG